MDRNQKSVDAQEPCIKLHIAGPSHLQILSHELPAIDVKRDTEDQMDAKYVDIEG